MNTNPVRMQMFAFVAFVLFGGLIARLWFLQGIESRREEFQAQAETNVLEVVFEEAPRGRILDRNGRVIVDNEIIEVVTLDRASIDEYESDMGVEARKALLLQLAVAISRSGRLTKVSDIEARLGDLSYGPLERVPVAVDVDPDLLVFLGERTDQFPGVAVEQRTVRSYPYGSLAAHLLGYVGPITREEYDQAQADIDPSNADAKTYQLNHEIGKTGIERTFENELRGIPGIRYLEVDRTGKVIDERQDRYRAPTPGNDVWLTIDLDLQALAEQQLANTLEQARQRDPVAGEPPIVAVAGSMVAVDPATGDVLVMASLPTYEPKDFVNGISTTQFEQLTAPENFSPVLNRAIQGTYAPGSTFKAVTSLAALEEGVLGPNGIREPFQYYRDTGTYIYSNCFEESDTCSFGSPFEGVRDVDLAQAITVSSDTYYYEIGGEGFWRLSSDPDEEGNRPDEGIQKWARRLGLGATTGIQLPYERSGVVPDRDYYDLQFANGVFAIDGDSWPAGSTINLSIGQGELLVTPLQLAEVYSIFANGGTVHQPNVVSKVTDRTGNDVRVYAPRVLRELAIPAEYLAPIEKGLLGVTMQPGGTAYRAFNEADFNIWNWPVAGKTGTAQVRDKADTSLFAAYGPVIDGGAPPEIAIAAILEESGFGSTAAAPAVAGVLERVASGTVPTAQPVTGYQISADADPAEAAQ